MKVLYLGNWGSNEGLSQSTINPHLEILQEQSQVELIIYVSIERQRSGEYRIPRSTKLIHKPYISVSSSKLFRMIGKAMDLYLIPKFIRQLLIKENIDLLIARSSPAGSWAYIALFNLKIPWCVESFEPHAEYMLDARVWSRFDPRYQLQKFFEARIAIKATYLITVSKHYLNYIKSKLDRQIYSFPCGVDHDLFRYSEKDRTRIREQHNLGNGVVGIYVGKFGDLYYKEEAFKIIKEGFGFFGNDFRVIILSPGSAQEIIENLQNSYIEKEKILIKTVPHIEVAAYLSAADFAFSFIKPSPVRRYCSPIKYGEYWANGLPILSPPGIGEDSDIIETQNVGAIFSSDFKNLKSAYGKIDSIVSTNNRLGKIAAIAEEYRHFGSLREIYSNLLVKK